MKTMKKDSNQPAMPTTHTRLLSHIATHPFITTYITTYTTATDEDDEEGLEPAGHADHPDETDKEDDAEDVLDAREVDAQKGAKLLGSLKNNNIMEMNI